MLSILQPDVLYLRIFTDKIELRHLASDRFVTKTAVKPFSNERLLIATVSVAISLISEAIQEIPNRKRWPKMSIVIQPMEKMDDGLSEVESMVLQDLALQIGARRVWIHAEKGHLSDVQIREIARV